MMRHHQARLASHLPASCFTDEELLLFSERESSPRRTAEIREHLAQCPDCQHRLAQLEAALTGFISLYEDDAQAQGPPRAESRNALKARLSEAAAVSAASSSWFPAAIVPWQLAGACVALAIVAVSIWAMRDIPLRRLSASAADQVASALPRKILTPGVAHTVGINDLCGNPGPENDPPVNPSLEQAVFKEYGVPASSKDGYEVDYLISPTLGGTGDLQNLWPEPYSTTPWGARAKDELEDRLHELVCKGKLPLATAQDEIATDWISAYKRYFNTETPLSNAAANSLPDIGDPDRELASVMAPIL